MLMDGKTGNWNFFYNTLLTVKNKKKEFDSKITKTGMFVRIIIWAHFYFFI